ncbi:MAG: penicillin-binding protein 2 [bacterium]|nr:penicillin-binding protein 2 [bacterium]
MWRQKKNSTPTNRLNILVSVVLLIGVLIGVRLFFLQIIMKDYYEAKAKGQQSVNLILEPRRGNIYLKNKNGEEVAAASTEQGDTLYLNNKFIIDSGGLLEKLNAVTPIDKDIFSKAISKANDPYEILKRRVTQEEADKILALAIPGVELESSSWRVYPAGDFLSHVLGFVGSSATGGADEGRYGIEKYYNNILAGDSSLVTADKDAKGFLIAIVNPLRSDPGGGEDVRLTIDPDLQKFIETEIEAARSKWQGKSAGVIIVQPKTGKVLAMAASPSFDPNNYKTEKDLGVFLNPFTQKIFEMGSVFKPLTMAAALNEGALTADTTYIDTGEVKIGSATIKNFDGKSHGKQTMTQVLEESLNTGAVFAMRKLGEQKLKTYFHNYGLGEKLGIDLPGELKGDLSNLDTGREIEFATASFGQGVAVTPLELAMALSSLGNGGKLMQPYLKDDQNRQPVVIRQVIKPETSVTISRMLVDVVDMKLAGGKAKIDSYSVAAKTGTAQMPNTGSKGYSGEYLHTFFGYFPAYDPQYLILLFLERPQGVKYASQSLTDTFSEITQFIINYYTLPPDR